MEAEIIRRLLARHRGALPPQTIVRIWRELLAGTTAMQGKFLITVCDTDPANAHALLAREQPFGALTPLRVHRSPAAGDRGSQLRGVATAAVLPMPTDGEPALAAWWMGLLHRGRSAHPRGRDAAILGPPPRGRAARAGADRRAAISPDPSAADRSLLGVEFSAELSRARLTAALTEAGFAPGRILLRREPGASSAHALVDVAGHVADADLRLAAIRRVLLQAPVVLGAYAVPVGGAAGMSTRAACGNTGDRALCRGRIDGFLASTASASCRPTRARSGFLPAPRPPMRAWPASCTRYPDGAAAELRRAIGQRFSLDPERIVCGAGSDDLIYQLLPRLWRAGHRADHDRARLQHLPDRRTVLAGSRVVMTRERRLTADVDADAGGGFAGHATGVPGQPQQPHRQHGAGARGGAAAGRAAGRRAAGPGRRLCRIWRVERPDYEPEHPAGRCRRQHSDDQDVQQRDLRSRRAAARLVLCAAGGRGRAEPGAQSVQRERSRAGGRHRRAGGAGVGRGRPAPTTPNIAPG